MKIFLQDIFGTVEIGIENMVQQFYSMNAEAGFKGISSAGGICVKSCTPAEICACQLRANIRIPLEFQLHDI
jgi:hypothetical protein